MKMERFTEKVLKNIGKLDSQNISSVVRTLQNEAHIMETIFNHLPEGVIFLDSQMRIVLVNRAARDMLSLGENQSIEGKLDNLISEGELLRVLKQSLKQPDRIVQEEIYLTRPRERLVLINIYPLFDFKDERMGNILTFWDITEKDRNEKNYFHIQRLESILKLAAGIAHEIGNPLNAIQIHLKLLEKEAGKQPAKTAKPFKAHLKAIQEEIIRIDQIMKHFLSATRQKISRFKLCQLNDIVSRSLQRFEFELKERKIKLKMSLSELPQAMLDSEKIEQLISNLVRNAIQAMPQGGKLDVMTQVKAPALLLLIKDTGEGISQEDMPQIFQPFYTTKQGGTGLGLMIVLDIVREHGGKIDVTSQKGKGTLMTVALPMRREKPLIAFQEKKS